MIRIGAIVLNVSDSARAAEFWGAALGYQPAGNPDFLVPASGEAPRVHLDEDDRTHLDLWTDSAAEQRAEVDRLVALGATRVEWDYPEGADFIVLADPDGTLFCVIDTSA
ncbi:VOC family protein [Brachybacterium sp. YJGR34]|uniref:VOC family protein n=1 Tax=Brachybacterium sp. YJGR34 TaxID=2059911 RepID=UPI000E0AEDA8|nr:VOC family protein [Brachybacterium sp. YJGR34]